MSETGTGERSPPLRFRDHFLGCHVRLNLAALCLGDSLKLGEGGLEVSTISWAMTSGGSRLSASSSAGSFNHVTSRLTLSRAMSSSYVNRLKRPSSVSLRAERSSA